MSCRRGADRCRSDSTAPCVQVGRLTRPAENDKVWNRNSSRRNHATSSLIRLFRLGEPEVRHEAGVARGRSDRISPSTHDRSLRAACRPLTYPAETKSTQGVVLHCHAWSGTCDGAMTMPDTYATAATATPGRRMIEPLGRMRRPPIHAEWSMTRTPRAAPAWYGSSGTRPARASWSR